MKHFLKKLLGPEIFRSMVSWTTIFFLIVKPPGPPSYILNVRSFISFLFLRGCQLAYLELLNDVSILDYKLQLTRFLIKQEYNIRLKQRKNYRLFSQLAEGILINTITTLICTFFGRVVAFFNLILLILVKAHYLFLNICSIQFLARNMMRL